MDRPLAARFAIPFRSLALGALKLWSESWIAGLRCRRGDFALRACVDGFHLVCSMEDADRSAIPLWEYRTFPINGTGLKKFRQKIRRCTWSITAGWVTGPGEYPPWAAHQHRPGFDSLSHSQSSPQRHRSSSTVSRRARHNAFHSTARRRRSRVAVPHGQSATVGKSGEAP